MSSTKRICNHLPKNLMPRNYTKAVKRPSPSGLPCRRCGAHESSGWRGINSRLCAKNTCKAEAAAESAHAPERPCQTEKQVPPVHESGDASSKAVPMAHMTIAVAVPLTRDRLFAIVSLHCRSLNAAPLTSMPLLSFLRLSPASPSRRRQHLDQLCHLAPHLLDK